MHYFDEHGLLTENLYELEENIILIALEAKQQINRYINDLMAETYDLIEISHFIKETLNSTYIKEMTKEITFEFLS